MAFSLQREHKCFLLFRTHTSEHVVVLNRRSNIPFRFERGRVHEAISPFDTDLLCDTRNSMRVIARDHLQLHPLLFEVGDRLSSGRANLIAQAYEAKGDCVAFDRAIGIKTLHTRHEQHARISSIGIERVFDLR